MTGWQITQAGKIEKINKVEMLSGVDSVKIKLTRTLLTAEDIAVYLGEDKAVKFPIIPGRMAVGQISELATESPYFEKGTRVCISPVRECGQCFHCATGLPEKCFDFKVAGKNSDGFLKEFAVADIAEIHALPASVKDSDAIYIEYVSLALSVIDKIKIEKGRHVAIIGGTVFGVILAQLVSYYQGIPIIIDENEDNLLLAKKSGVEYTFKPTSKLDKDFSAITGGRMASKIVYVTRAGIPTELAFRLATPSGIVAFVGFFYPNIKIAVNIAMQKQLTTIAITNGYGNMETAINILANKAIDLSQYALPITKMEDIEKNIEKMADDYKNGRPVKNLLINMLG